MSQIHAGKRAFRDIGAGARNPHNRKTTGYVEFQSGFNIAKDFAHERSLDEAAAYHALSVRDNAVDRDWVERFSERNAH